MIRGVAYLACAAQGVFALYLAERFYERLNGEFFMALLLMGVALLCPVLIYLGDDSPSFFRLYLRRKALEEQTRIDALIRKKP